MNKNINKVIKRLPKKIVAFTMVLAMVFTYFLPLTEVLANNTYGEGDYSINLDITNELGFTINSVTINSSPWTTHLDEYHSDNNQFHIIVNVSGNESTGDKIPKFYWGGNWNGEDGTVTSSRHTEEGGYEFAVDVTINGSTKFVGLTLGEQGEEAGPEPGEGYFDGKAYVLWSCGNGVCYHYFDNIPDFNDGNSTLYKDTTVTADNKPGATFDVHADYIGWYLASEFNDWQELYELVTGEEVDWNTLDPELILGEPNQHIGELENAAVSSNACTRPENNSPREEREAFERCINRYAAEHNHEIWTHKLQPVGEPTANNAYVSYGDRNFKVVIYNSEYKGIAMGDLSELSYYPSHWTDPFIKRDHFDLSGTTRNKPALLDSILLESTVVIKELNYNSFKIASIEALDVPDTAVAINKVNGEFRLVFSSNFYDNVTFKVTDTNGEVSYMLIKRYTIDGWIRHDGDRAILTADFYFDNEKSYHDFELTAKIVHKNGTTRNVRLTAVNRIDDGLGNITNDYEVDEATRGGKGLKKAVFEVNLDDGEEETIQDIYLNAEYEGSTESNYAGAYVGSGEGVLANIYHGEGE